MKLSYWEIKSWLSNIDYTVIGSGIVGLNCALHLKLRYPKANVLILEKGILPQGASTKNAGFACFGSLSEIIDDLENHTEDEVLRLIEKRYNGLELLRETLGDKAVDYKELGGFELFTRQDDDLYDKCLKRQEKINKLLHPFFKTDVFSWQSNNCNFNNIKSKISFNRFEGQIDTGKMMATLLQKVQIAGVRILNNCLVNSYSEDLDSVKIKTEHFEYSTSKLIITTNGFASELIGQSIKPARAQVLITKPIDELHIKGTFHLDRGYYYFRNIDNRILLGGGRHLDFKGEETTEFGETQMIQSKLEELLQTIILPNEIFEIDHRWSGIMGIGEQKKAIVKQLSNNVYCGVRLGGMGVAIGSLIGKELAHLIE